MFHHLLLRDCQITGCYGWVLLIQIYPLFEVDLDVSLRLLSSIQFQDMSQYFESCHQSSEFDIDLRA